MLSVSLCSQNKWKEIRNRKGKDGNKYDYIFRTVSMNYIKFIPFMLKKMNFQPMKFKVNNMFRFYYLENQYEWLL